MAVANGYGKVVTSGSVFMYDVGDAVNSYKGKPTTNFYTNGHFSGGNGISQEGGSNATNTVIQLPNPGNSPYVLQQTMGVAYTEYQINLTNQLQSSTTYVLSGWYAESADYVGASRMFHCRAFSTSGAHVALGTGIGTVLKTVEVGGLTWRLCYATITTPADYSNDFNWYVGYDGGNYTGARYYTNLMMEVGTTPSQFVDGTRSATQGLLPLIGNSTLDLSSVSFDSTAQITFDGTDDDIEIPFETILNDCTIELVFKATSTGLYQYPLAIRNNSVGSSYAFYMDMNDSDLGTAAQTMWTYWNSGGTPYSVVSRTGTNGNFGDWNDSNWRHYVFTRSTTVAPYTQHYMNGSLVNNVSRAGDQTTQFGNGAGYKLYLGSINGASGFFKGNLPIVKIYNRVLSAAEVKQNYNKYKTRFNLP
jgi:hypothetical protein